MELPNKIIAVDFDGTLCQNKWPKIGEPNSELIRYLKEEKKAGAKLILWTCRDGKQLEEALEFCKFCNLSFDAVNDNLPEAKKMFGGNPRKVFAHEYIDDRSNTLFKLPYYKPMKQINYV